jgi:hypothetical protein
MPELVTSRANKATRWRDERAITTEIWWVRESYSWRRPSARSWRWRWKDGPVGIRMIVLCLAQTSEAHRSGSNTIITSLMITHARIFLASYHFSSIAHVQAWEPQPLYTARRTTSLSFRVPPWPSELDVSQSLVLVICQIYWSLFGFVPCRMCRMVYSGWVSAFFQREAC